MVRGNATSHPASRSVARPGTPPRPNGAARPRAGRTPLSSQPACFATRSSKSRRSVSGASRSGMCGDRNSIVRPQSPAGRVAGAAPRGAEATEAPSRVLVRVLSLPPSWNSFGRNVTVFRSVLTSWSRSPSTSFCLPPVSRKAAMSG